MTISKYCSFIKFPNLFTSEFSQGLSKDYNNWVALANGIPWWEDRKVQWRSEELKVQFGLAWASSLQEMERKIKQKKVNNLLNSCTLKINFKISLIANCLRIYASTVRSASFCFLILNKCCVVFEQRIEGEINFSSQKLAIEPPLLARG